MAAALAAGAAAADPGTAISFQGELRDGLTAPTAPYDFEVALYTVAENGSAVDTRAFDDVPVDLGQFEVEPDFTDVPFAAGAAYWLEVRVRAGDSSGAFTPLLPRQRITPAPYALNARTVQADGIDAAAIANGAVGAAEVDSSQVQRRVGSCAAGMAVQSVASDGTPACVATGTLTALTAGAGLAGGGNAGGVTLSVGANAIGSALLADNGVATVDLGPNVVTAAKIDSAQVQRRVTGSCSAGSGIIAVNADGTVSCDVQNASQAPDRSFRSFVGSNGASATVIGEDGLPFIAMHDVDDGRLLAFHCNDAACSAGTQTIVDTGNVGAYPSVTLVDGLPQIAYRDVANTSLKLAVCNNADCSAPALRLLDNSADVGEFAQIALSSGGSGAVVAYYDRDGGNLRLAVCNNIPCTAPVSLLLDDGGANDVGRNVSAFTFNSRLVVGYHDVTANRFKVAECVVFSGTCSGLMTFNADIAGSGYVSAIAMSTAGVPRFFWGRGATLQTALCADALCTALTAPVQIANRTFTAVAASRDRFGHSVFVGRHFSGVDQGEVWRCADVDCTTARPTSIFNFGAGVSLDAGVSIVLGGHGEPVYTIRAGNDTRLVICADELCNATMRR